MEDYLWWRDGVIYQVYPRSFADGNGDGLGDLPGIISKLEYLHDLGVAAIWLSPIYPSPDADFGYDVSDHCAVDPRYGTMQDFDNLVVKAHQLGIRVVLDVVMNHTSDQHPWFQESRSSLGNPKRDWYLWRKNKNNWKAIFGGPGWTLDEQTGEYYFHMFLPEQPDVNWRNPELRKAQMAVFRFWLEHGVDGFRLDVFNAFFKDEQLRDNPTRFGLRAFDRQEHIFDIDQDELFSFLKELRNMLDEYPHRYSVGETFLSERGKAAKYVGNNLLHAAFSFDFTSLEILFPWNPGWISRQVMKREEYFQSERWPTTVMSNHDVQRAADRYSKNEDDSQAKLAMALLLTLRGTPFLYYGEEIGMRQLKLKHSEIMDPPGKRYWPIFKTRDGCRSPMQWNANQYSGFSEVKPWLKVHQDYLTRNVETQKLDPDSIFHLTRSLIALRKATPALTRGSYVPVMSDSRHVLAFLRETVDQTILVILNFSRKQVRVNLDPSIQLKSWRPIFPTDAIIPDLGKLLLPAGAIQLYELISS